MVDIFRVRCSSHKNVTKIAVPALQEPFLHDFLQEKNILGSFQSRGYAGPFTLVKSSFVTVVCVQISRQLCAPFCLISVWREEAFSKAQSFLGGFGDKLSTEAGLRKSAVWGKTKACASAVCSSGRNRRESWPENANSE